ncbi:unnamed protein product [Caenorhabditis bovis]|uniref:SH2 domain-containing protein n=1 Tax=Caenorhabditis bovis TaxID=2654633 RepID=A0A8S1FF92_9PELO|nr:unnamed protein product [Caenorhabditis bovis]
MMSFGRVRRETPAERVLQFSCCRQFPCFDLDPPAIHQRGPSVSLASKIPPPTVEEIENVVGQAFEAQSLTKTIGNSAKSTTSTTVNLAAVGGTMNEKRSASTVFLNKFLGKKGSQTVDDSACKRKRRPVSAVFSSAIHRLSNSTTSMNPKRMTTTELCLNKKELNHIRMRSSNIIDEHVAKTSSSLASGTGSSSSDIENQKRVSSSDSSAAGSSTSPIPPTLVFEEKLGEWIYPIDETIKSQLDNCNYFVGLPSRDSIIRNLMSQPEGAFVVRYSESKKKCLALSMRVPATHNPAGISHYLIIRNEHGFRLKLSGSNKPFPTLQMLLTHFSVLEGNLPCPLHFVQWDKSLWKQQTQHHQPTAERHRHSTALTKIDENRNLTSSHSSSQMLFTPRRCGAEDFTTPKRRSRHHDINSIRRTQFFEIESPIIS